MVKMFSLSAERPPGMVFLAGEFTLARAEKSQGIW